MLLMVKQQQRDGEATVTFEFKEQDKRRWVVVSHECAGKTVSFPITLRVVDAFILWLNDTLKALDRKRIAQLIADRKAREE